MDSADFQGQTVRQQLLQLLQRGIQAVAGQAVVAGALEAQPMPVGPCAVLAIGKAAATMALGARQLLTDRVQATLVITKQGHCASLPVAAVSDAAPLWSCLESSHPVPDDRSLLRGQELVKFLQGLPVGLPLLVLLSGGASALVELLPEGMSSDDWAQVNRWLLASGYPIQVVNAIRQQISCIKGGKLCHWLGRRYVRQLLISDVPGDDPRLIGSGLLSGAVEPPAYDGLPAWLQHWLPDKTPQTGHDISLETQVVASNAMACAAIADAARQLDRHRQTHVQMMATPLQGEATVMAQQMLAQLRQLEAGVYIWGGETTVSLPDQPGQGGRNQQLALALACGLAGSHGITVLAAGTDGSDGQTEDAGAIVDGQTLSQAGSDPLQAQAFLQAADAGSLLAEAGALLSTGPTGTNVMDVVIARVEAGANWPE